MPARRHTLYATLTLLVGLAVLGACEPTPAPSPQPNPHPAPTDPRKADADADSATVVSPIERFG
jgi:hypothetical protein